jgi:hypothetical protein
MGRKNLFDLLANGDSLDAADVTALKLPAVASAISAYVDEGYPKYVPGPMQRVELKVTDMPVAVANTTGISFGSVQLLDFPQGRIMIDGGTVNLVVDWSASADGDGEEIALTGSGDAALGTAATADGTLSGAEVDVMASTAMTDPFVAGVGDLHGNLVKDTEFDGTATAKDVYLNVIIDDADVGDTDNAIVYFTGTIILHCKFLGDY